MGKKEKNEKVTLEGVIAETPKQVRYEDYNMRYPTLKRILKLILDVEKVCFSGEPCEVPDQIPIGYDGIPPIFEGDRIRTTKIFSERDVWLGYYRLKEKDMLLIPEQIELLDNSGKIKATYIQDQVGYDGGFVSIES